jgi:hypothetical protein
MAISGKNNPDLGAVKVGASRGEVEMHLGSPVNSSTLENGNRVEIYEYQTGNEPSAGRAVGHAVMDVLTLGIWEIAGTPIEGFQGEKYRAIVIYGDDDKLTDIKTSNASSNM